MKKDTTRLRIYLQDKLCFPDLTVREQFLDFDKEYKQQDFIECAENYRGYKEKDEINQWLSQIFEEEVMIIRAPKDRLMMCSGYIPNQLPTDRRGAFVTDAAIHIINKKSVDCLRNVMYNKYRDDTSMLSQVNADLCVFRASFIIDEEWEDPYCEDEFQEMRIANIMFR